MGMKKHKLLLLLPILVIVSLACVMQAKGNPLPQVNTLPAELPPTETMTFTPSTAPSATETGTPTIAITDTPTPLMQSTPTPFDLADYGIARGDRFTVLEDVTYPDATVLRPAELILKTWRIENTGTKTWNDQYIITYIDNNTYNGPIAARLMFYPPESHFGWNIGSWPDPLEEVKPGDVVDVTLVLQTPNKHGYQFGSWAIINDEGLRLPDLLWSQLQVQGSIPEDQLGWNSTWIVNDPFIGDIHYPTNLSVEVSDEWIHGYFYNHFGETVLLSGLAGKDRTILDGLYGLTNQRVSGTRVLLQVGDDSEYITGTVWYDMSNHGTLCGARTEKRYERYCLPDEPTPEETKTNDSTPTPES